MNQRGKQMAFYVKFVIIFIVFTVLLVSLAPNLTKVDACGIDTHIAETKHIGNQSYFPQWLGAIFNNVVFGIFLGFVLSFFGTYITDCLRERRKIKRFYQAAYIELKQALIGLLTYVICPDSTIDEEKARLWWSSIRNFDLMRMAFPTEYKTEYEKLKNVELQPEVIRQFILDHELQKNDRCTQKKMMPQNELNCAFISRNIDTLSGLNIQDISSLLNILRKIDVLNAHTGYIDFVYKKTFDSSISDSNYKILKYNYYSECQYISDHAKTIALEAIGLLTKWQKEILCSDGFQTARKKSEKIKPK